MQSIIIFTTTTLQWVIINMLVLGHLDTRYKQTSKTTSVRPIFPDSDLSLHCVQALQDVST